jgi:hypothetical protein
VTTSTDLITKGKRLGGYVFQNSGTAATIELRDGSITGTPYITIPLAVGSTTPTFAVQDYSVPLPLFVGGVFVKVTGGTIVGSVQVE